MSGKRSKEMRKVRDEMAAKMRVNRKLSRWQRFCNWFYGQKETGKLNPAEIQRLHNNIKRIVRRRGAAQLSE